MCQILSSQGDPRPLGEVGRPIAIAGSPFDVWVAYPHAMVAFQRIGPPRPRWYGSAQGLPAEGIASLCYDESTQSLWIGSTTNRSYRWSPGLEIAQESALPAAGCVTRSSRQVAVSDLPPLYPSSPGWLQSAGDLVGPDGLHQQVRFGLILDGRDLWVVTSTGIWTGHSSSGRIEPVPSGLAESCTRSVVRDMEGQAWLLGCQGSISVVDATDRPKANFRPDDPQLYQLRQSLMLGPSSEGGIWVSVLDGLIRMDSRGIQDAWTGRKAPFGGRTLSCLDRMDTTWCGTENSLVRRAPSDRSFRVEAPPWDVSSPVRGLFSTPAGILAATDRGFWLRGPKGW
jgi:ligand-binding sensor domain-containing protein